MKRENEQLKNSLTAHQFSVLGNALTLKSMKVNNGDKSLSHLSLSIEEIAVHEHLANEWIKATNLYPQLNPLELAIYLKSKGLFEEEPTKKIMNNTLKLMGKLS